MTPRSYTQVRRAESSADTARRIRESALALYKERGVAATTLQAVAERADVSRGTVLNHFGSADGLLEAVLDAVVTSLEYPDERMLEGAHDRRDRILRYVDAMFRFFVRSEDAWPAFSRDLDHPILQRREAEYFEIAARLYAATFEDLAGDRIVAATARAYVNYGPLNDMRAAGLSLDETIAVVGDSLIAVASDAERRARTGTGRRKG